MQGYNIRRLLFDQSCLIHNSVYCKQRDRADAKRDELLSRISADIIMMQQNRALSEINEYAEFAKQIQEFTAHWKRRCKIQKRCAGYKVKNVDFSSCESR
jgi:hypothetical protein